MVLLKHRDRTCGQEELLPLACEGVADYIPGSCEAKVRRYMQVGSESQIDHCLGVNYGQDLAGPEKSLCVRG